MNIYPLVFNTVQAVLGEPKLLPVFRRPYAVGLDGIVVAIGPPQRFLVRATVVSTPPNNLERNPEMQLMQDSIEVTTDFPLQGPVRNGRATDFQPDEVVWHGETYLVTGLYDFSKGGKGFVKASCQCVNRISSPPMQP